MSRERSDPPGRRSGGAADLGQGVALASARGRGLVAASACGSAVAFLDASVVNVALPTIGRDLHADLGALQWTVNAYTLVLAALVLAGGSLGDRLGRRRVFVVGVSWFALASLACALAPSPGLLVTARAVQGVGAALLTPTSLALLQTSVREADRARAIGLWSGSTTLATVSAPLVGGALVGLDWRWVFAVNLPVSAAAVVLAVRCAPAEPGRPPARPQRPAPVLHATLERFEHGRSAPLLVRGAAPSLDVAGAALGALALGATTWALITAGRSGASAAVVAAGLVAVAAGAAFLVRERRARDPLVPLSLFADRTFAATNAFTLLVYAGISGLGLLVTLQLQVSLGYSAVAAGAATLPAPLLLGLLSSRAAALGQRLGPRAVLTTGAATGSVGFALLAFTAPGDSYVLHVLPGVVLFGLGGVLYVAPLTATVLAAAPQALAGAASGVNNAVARTAGLLAVAGLPAVAGLSGDAYAQPALLTPAYRTAMLICALLVGAGAAVALVGLPRRAGLAPPATAG